jgi:hypothetical protein
MTNTHRETAAHDSRTATSAVDHEVSDVNVRAIFIFCAGLFVLAVGVNALIWLMFQYFSGRESVRLSPAYPLATGQAARLPPEPRLQTNPRGDLQELRLHEDAVLGTYGWVDKAAGWVDKAAGVVRLPIDTAMRLTLQRGLPARSGPGEVQK